MEQLVRSLKRINSAKQIDNRNFQAHIFFDNGCRGKKLTQFALQLVHVVKEVLGMYIYMYVILSLKGDLSPLI